MGSRMQEAIEQMQKKDEAGLNYIYSKTFNYVYLRGKSLLQKETEVQKLMKEVYTLAFKSANDLKEEEMYEWLGKRTYMLGSQYYRKKKAREAFALEFDKNDMIMGKNTNSVATVEAMNEVLDQLPELYQATFYAFYYDFMSVTDIAEVMDCTVGVILHRLNYTAKYVKEAFAIYNEEKAKDKREKAIFSVETVCHALRKWSIEHCLGMATAQNLYASICKDLELKAGSIQFEGIDFAGVNNTVVHHKLDDLSSVLAEIELYSPKEKADKKKYVAIAVGAIAIVLVAVALITGIGGRGEKDPQVQEPVQNEVEEQQGVSDNEVVDDEIVDDEVVDSEVVENETVEDETVENQDEEDVVVDGDNTETEVVPGEYLLPTSNTAALTSAELQGMTKTQLRLARNEIYARHGMIFGVEDLDAYFATKSWYEAKYESDVFYDNVEMSIIEEENIQFILSVEQNME